MKTVYQNKPREYKPTNGGYAQKSTNVRSRNWPEHLITVTVIATLLLFMYTAVSKLLNYDLFVFQMQLVPSDRLSRWAPFLGRAVPIIELILVLLLYLNKTRLWGLIGSLTLMLSFEAYIAWMKIMEIQTGMRLPCTCGGIVSQMGWTTHLYFNGIFILLLSLSIYFLQTWKKHQTL